MEHESGDRERIFLGWRRPLLPLAAEWLLARRGELAGWRVVVPTSHCGRRLRQALAEGGGAVLSPRFCTPGGLLREVADGGGVAPEWLEVLGWMEVLERQRDWSEFAALFPDPPGVGEGRGWSLGLARQFVALRRALQEGGMLIAGAARRLEQEADGGRWKALAVLEGEVERWLTGRGVRSRSAFLAGPGWHLPKAAGYVLAGVADMPPVVGEAFRRLSCPVRVLVAAPDDEADAFSSLGLPLEGVWGGRPLFWPESGQGSVVLAADPGEQAARMVEAVAAAGTSSEGVAFASADAGTASEASQIFTRQGWEAFDPAALSSATGLRRWLGVWGRWMERPRLSVVRDLLALPETGVLVRGRRADKAAALARVRDAWLAVEAPDVRRCLEREGFGRVEVREAAAQLLEETLQPLESWRARLSRDGVAGLIELLDMVARTGQDTANEVSGILEQAEMMSELQAEVDVPSRVWLDLLAAELPPAQPDMPDGRVVDVLGWLEVFLEPGRHLLLGGLNEGLVPAGGGGDPWLGEAARRVLGLPCDSRRAARDAYLFHAMCEARREGGRVDLFCAKTAADGSPLAPSRVMLAAPADELPSRVRLLFAEVDPPEAGMRFALEWKWRPPTRRGSGLRRVSITALPDYLRCPLRFYLKHVLKYQDRDADRGEWNARDFGNVAHAVLEAWGRDEAARECGEAEGIAAWVLAELDREVERAFGEQPPLAIRLQTEALRRRLEWFAHRQAEHFASGWRVHAVEEKMEEEVGDIVLVGKIDRVDKHVESGAWMVIDYKTGKMRDVMGAHLRKAEKDGVVPAHLVGSPAVWQREKVDRKGSRMERMLWRNLQLPSYAVVWRQRFGGSVMPAYFMLSDKEAEVRVAPWDDFSEADAEAAWKCVRHVLGRVAEGVFWPPAAKVDYDDYAMLAPEGILAEHVEAPELWREAEEGGDDSTSDEVEYDGEDLWDEEFDEEDDES